MSSEPYARDMYSIVAMCVNEFYLAHCSWDRAITVIPMDRTQWSFTLEGHTNSLHALAIHRHQLFSASADATIREWDLTLRTCVNTWCTDTNQPAWTLLLSRDGTMLFGGLDYTVVQWETSLGRTIRTFSGHTAAIRTLCFSPDERHIYSGSRDTRIKEWCVATGRCVRTRLGHRGLVTTLATSEAYLWSAASDQTLKQWDRHTGDCIRTISVPDTIQRLLYLSAHDTLISGSIHAMHTWDASDTTCRQRWTPHTGMVTGLVARGEHTVFSSSADSTICRHMWYDVWKTHAVETYLSRLWPQLSLDLIRHQLMPYVQQRSHLMNTTTK
jgi:WD40 repeat protein